MLSLPFFEHLLDSLALREEAASTCAPFLEGTRSGAPLPRLLVIMCGMWAVVAAPAQGGSQGTCTSRREQLPAESSRGETFLFWADAHAKGE